MLGEHGKRRREDVGRRGKRSRQGVGGTVNGVGAVIPETALH
jgi:hypothetical protein